MIAEQIRFVNSKCVIGLLLKLLRLTCLLFYILPALELLTEMFVLCSTSIVLLGPGYIYIYYVYARMYV